MTLFARYFSRLARSALWVARIGATAAILFRAATAHAYPSYLDEVPASSAQCLTCHRTAGGGGACATPPCLNPFGQRFDNSGHSWADIANLNSDGDECSNGEELGDADGDGSPDIADFCARSPGLTSGQCGEAGSCSPVDRDRLPCECNPELPEPHLLNDESSSAMLLVDGSPTAFNALTATSTEAEASCTRGLRDVWFRYVPDCSSGTAHIELTNPAAIVVYEPGLTPGAEIACEASTQSLSVPAGELYIRVAGGRGEITVTCEPDASAFPGHGCGTAIPIENGIREVHVRTGFGPRPNESCSMQPGSDLWFEYEATCAGQAVFSLQARPDDRTHAYCAAAARVTMAVYRQAQCPDRGEALVCEAGVPNCSGQDVVAEAPVRPGDRVYLRIGRNQGLSFERDLSVRCLTGNLPCDSFCAPEAICVRTPTGPFDPTVGPFFGVVPECSCAEGSEGDGVLPELSGTGCRLVAPCEELHLTCEHGACGRDPDDGSIGCDCEPGYHSIGATCRDTDECETEEGIGACRTNVAGARTRCVNYEGGFACGCELGYSAQPNELGFNCVIACADGIAGPGEECDDGNLSGGDGCDRDCRVEHNFECRGLPGDPSVCETTCGDGLLSPNEDPNDCLPLPWWSCTPRGTRRASAWLWFLVPMPWLARRATSRSSKKSPRA